MVEHGPTLETYRREIEQLHDFFVEWYTGDCTAEAFERMESVIASDFEMVSPEGERMGREAVLEMVRDGRDKHDTGTFDIDIRDVTILDSGTDHALVRYEEWQTTDDETDGRISTVLFRPRQNAPNGLVWMTVHETWLENSE